MSVFFEVIPRSGEPKVPPVDQPRSANQRICSLRAKRRAPARLHAATQGRERGREAARDYISGHRLLYRDSRSESPYYCRREPSLVRLVREDQPILAVARRDFQLLEDFHEALDFAFLDVDVINGKDV